MNSLTPRHTFQFIRRTAAVLALVGMLSSSLGIVFVPAAKQDPAHAFPCQGGGCGCSSAAQCWQSCCCTTVAERLAWADTNDVKPPAFLTKLLAASTAQPVAAESKSCCSHLASEEGSASSCVEERSRELPARVVLLSDISRCHGLSKYIAIFGSAICEPSLEAPAFDLVAVSWLRSLDESFESPLHSPPSPPPRIAV
ncbi:MAG: hypothetical protein H8E66_32055 [Planctomycetes bacterium]|nr:hypothetical protein [Planctomycetota bacterium]